MKKIFVFVLLFLSIFVIAGCGKDTDDKVDIPKEPEQIETPEKVEVEQVLISALPKLMFVGESFDLSCLVLPHDATNKEIEWIFSKPDIIGVYNDKIHPLKPGNEKITVVSKDNNSISANFSFKIVDSIEYDENTTISGVATHNTFSLTKNKEMYSYTYTTSYGYPLYEDIKLIFRFPIFNDPEGTGIFTIKAKNTSSVTIHFEIIATETSCYIKSKEPMDKHISGMIEDELIICKKKYLDPINNERDFFFFP